MLFVMRSPCLASLKLPSGSETLSRWNRVEGFIEECRKEKPVGGTPGEDQLEVIARNIVRFGLKNVVAPTEDSSRSSLKADPMREFVQPGSRPAPGTPPDTILCPFEKHGKIKTADRHDIDNFFSIKRIMEKYRNRPDWKSPLSIAVFGPPGSGKSFTVRQILDSVDPEIAAQPLDYNVAQFRGIQDLETAFHRAQDRVLAGKLPLVVFDEFDSTFGSEPLGWLKYFLAPMQDGQFKAGESMYGIGRAIFVFAGGISRTFSDFYDKRKENPAFKSAKGPDFVSRLRGFLNIPGINAGEDDGSSSDGAGPTSITPILMFRRAILLRSLLEDHLKECLDPTTEEFRIDPNVVRAFLRVTRYEHGARSMQAIIEMAKVSSRGKFQKSSLPDRAQLKMHVDAEVFLDLLDRPSSSC